MCPLVWNILMILFNSKKNKNFFTINTKFKKKNNNFWKSIKFRFYQWNQCDIQT